MEQLALYYLLPAITDPVHKIPPPPGGCDAASGQQRYLPADCPHL